MGTACYRVGTLTPIHWFVLDFLAWNILRTCDYTEHINPKLNFKSGTAWNPRPCYDNDNSIIFQSVRFWFLKEIIPLFVTILVTFRFRLTAGWASTRHRIIMSGLLAWSLAQYHKVIAFFPSFRFSFVRLSAAKKHHMHWSSVGRYRLPLPPTETSCEAIIRWLRIFLPFDFCSPCGEFLLECYHRGFPVDFCRCRRQPASRLTSLGYCFPTGSRSTAAYGLTSLHGSSSTGSSIAIAEAMPPGGNYHMSRPCWHMEAADNPPLCRSFHNSPMLPSVINERPLIPSSSTFWFCFPGAQ